MKFKSYHIEILSTISVIIIFFHTYVNECINALSNQLLKLIISFQWNIAWKRENLGSCAVTFLEKKLIP